MNINWFQSPWWVIVEEFINKDYIEVLELIHC